MNKYSLAALSVCGGVLSGLAWTEWCPGLILLCSFVPFFIIENHLFENKRRYSPNACFVYLLPGFVIFSILTLGWIRVVSMTAAICVILTASIAYGIYNVACTQDKIKGRRHSGLYVADSFLAHP